MACPSQYDLRFSRNFGTSPGFWLRLQLDYDLMRAERENGERTNAKSSLMRREVPGGVSMRQPEILKFNRQILLVGTRRY